MSRTLDLSNSGVFPVKLQSREIDRNVQKINKIRTSYKILSRKRDMLARHYCNARTSFKAFLIVNRWIAAAIRVPTKRSLRRPFPRYANEQTEVRRGN